MSVRIRKNKINNTSVIRIIGSIAAEEVHKLSHVIEECRKEGEISIALNLSETEFLDSSALGMLILNHKILQKQGGRLVLVNPGIHMREILENSRLDQIFKVFSSEDEL